MKIILIILVPILLSIKGYCSENHVIISIDLRSEITMYERSSVITKIKSIVPELLSSNQINSGYASVQLFSAHENAEDLDKYMLDVNNPFTPFSDVHSVLNSLKESDFYQYHGNYYSVVTIAKPYSLLKYRTIAPEKLVERTYLILITDYKYNGNDDFYGELKHVPRISDQTKKVIMNTIKDVQQNYFYKFIDEINISIWPHSGYVSLFEVIPLQQYFTVESVLEFPHKITAARTKNGYNATFSIRKFDNPNYRFLRSEAYIPVKGFDTVQKIDEFEKKYSFNIPNELVNKVRSDSLFIIFKTWVRLIDNVYNHTTLTPNGTNLQGAEGLNRRINIELEEDVKILGCIPLFDILYSMSFWTDNQHTAAATWSWIFVLMILAVIIFIIWQSTQYRNKNNDVKI